MAYAFQILLDKRSIHIFAVAFRIFSGCFVLRDFIVRFVGRSGKSFFRKGGIKHKGDTSGVYSAFDEHFCKLAGMNNGRTFAKPHRCKVFGIQRGPSACENNSAYLVIQCLFPALNVCAKFAWLAFQPGDRGIEVGCDLVIGQNFINQILQIGWLLVCPGG